jgi:hypothetical protein
VVDGDPDRPGIRKGIAWGTPSSRDPDLVVVGGDADLAAAFATQPGARFGFEPDAASDLAATLGLRPGSEPAGLELRIDVLWIALDEREEIAVCANATSGCRPEALRRSTRRRECQITIDGQARRLRAAGVVIANAQHLDRMRIVPRGHPGDGRAEAQWFGLGPAQRAKFRDRLPTGDHLDHPDVGRTSFRTLAVGWNRPAPVRLDSRPVGTAKLARVRVEAGALRLCV